MLTRLSVLSLFLFALGCSVVDNNRNPRPKQDRTQGWTKKTTGPTKDLAEEAVSVKAVYVVRKPISRYLIANTSLEPIREITVYAKVNALVEDLLVEEGDLVKNDQLLAKLDDKEIRNEYNQARIAVSQSRLTLEQAEIRSRLSRANYKRSEDLVTQKLISPQEHDQAALTNETDSLAVTLSFQERDAAVSRMEAAQLQLDYTAIRSSINGVVTERLIDIGDRVNLNEALFVVQDFHKLWARIFIPEKEISQVRIGQQAKLKMQAYPEKFFRGSIKMISPIVDSDSGTIKVTLEVETRQNRLRPGMFGTVYITTETHPLAIVVPVQSIVRERDENRVFVVGKDNRVKKRKVEIGFREDNEVEISSGLSEGETVVTVGQEGLNDGYLVSILEWEDTKKGALSTIPLGENTLTSVARLIVTPSLNGSSN